MFIIFIKFKFEFPSIQMKWRWTILGSSVYQNLAVDFFLRNKTYFWIVWRKMLKHDQVYFRNTCTCLVLMGFKFYQVPSMCLINLINNHNICCNGTWGTDGMARSLGENNTFEMYYAWKRQHFHLPFILWNLEESSRILTANVMLYVLLDLKNKCCQKNNT